MAAGQTSLLEKKFTAGGAISAFTCVKFGSDDNSVVAATAATDVVIGIAQHDASSGEGVRVMMLGISRAKAGGTITRGALVGSDASGQVVALAPAAGTNNYAVGYALASAASGDIIPVLVVPSRPQG
jgi:hypothetical protein